MTQTLTPNDVLWREPSVRMVALPDRRLLIRHRRGVSVLGGVSAEDLGRILDLVDGQRTAEAICAELANEYETADVVRILESLVGDVLHRQQPRRTAAAETAAPSPPPAIGGRLLVIGNGPAARRLAADLSRELTVVEATEVGDHLGAADLVVGALEDVTYRALFDLQRYCLGAGVPSLFVTFDPDGIRVGPTVVPGTTACVACAQIANFRFLHLDAPSLITAVGDWRSDRPEAELAPVAEVVAREVTAILAPDGEPALLTTAVKIGDDGSTARLRVARDAACPLCGSEAALGRATRRAAQLAARAEPELMTLHARAPRRVTIDEPESCTRVGILGGGSAGYLTALALHKLVPRIDVTLIESSAVPIIGVGEATTPLMPQFLHADLGLDVHELFREVRPTLKLGIRFVWGRSPEADFNYPFGAVDVLSPYAYEGHVRNCSLQSMMMTADVVPVLREGAGWRSLLDTEIAYHLDNERFVAYLRRRARELGVRHVDAMISDVELSSDGEEVRALIAEDGRRLELDLYVDASGFRSLLLEKSLGSEFVSFSKSLLTDCAVVAAVPHGGHVRPYTVAEAMRCGWCWNTPQPDADHRGYVYSSAFLRPEQAAAEMLRKNPGMGEYRMVNFRAGRHRHFWKGNVVAVGNSYGFVEPLESTALHMLIRHIGLLVRAFPVRRGERGIRELLNRRVSAWWDYLHWFLTLHYRFNRSWETPFWRAAREAAEIGENEELIATFRERGPLSYDRSARALFNYPDPLWGAEGIDVLLLGQRVAAQLPPPACERAAWEERMRLGRSLVGRAADQQQALALVRDHPELLDRLAAAFRAVGPAFATG